MNTSKQTHMHVCTHAHAQTHTHTHLFYLTLLCLEGVCGHAIANINPWRVGTVHRSYLFFPAHFLLYLTE